MYTIENVEPKEVFHYFKQICEIPHGSGNVGQISNYLIQFAKQNQLEYHTDEVGNVIIIKEATEGYEDHEPLMIQGHMDMVAVKTPECAKDMEKEGLDVCVDGDYFYAKNTSLGGDDGIAVAMGLALLASDTLKHPRLEVVITVNEETGMDGARAIDLSVCKANHMLNLDSEEEGHFLAGCAGGARVHVNLPLNKEKKEVPCYELQVSGLNGGHSGVEIDKGRGNANMILGRVLKKLCEKAELNLITMNGGLADNAIPREAMAEISYPGEMQALEDQLAQIENELKLEYEVADPDVTISVKHLGLKQVSCADVVSTLKAINLLTALPNGIQAMNMSIPGMVETSLNLGMLTTDGEVQKYTFSVRSSITSAKNALIEKLAAVAALAGASYDVTGDYPGWAFNPHSAFRDKMVQIYQDMFDTKPEVMTMHAGLECGLFLEKKPELDCVSMGPDIYNIHTTEERLSISSTERVWRFVKTLVETC